MECGFKTTSIQDACATRSLTLDEIGIPAETVDRTALAELTLFTEVKPLTQFLSEML